MTRVIIVMGVSGVGKTTIGKALAEKIGADFAEGDSYHPKENVEKMRSGQPLSDDDRWPWLDRLRAEIEGWLNADRPVVLACSALKASYRQRLHPNGPNADSGPNADAGPSVDGGPSADGVRFVYLHGTRNLIEERLAARKGHYMPASLLDSQLATLQPPDDAIAIDVDRPLDEILADLISLLESGD